MRAGWGGGGGTRLRMRSVRGKKTKTYLARLSTDRSSPMVDGI